MRSKDDLISRQAVIEELLKCGDYYNGNEEAKRGVAQCIGTIYDIPAVCSYYKEAWEMLEWAVKKHITACTSNITYYTQNLNVTASHIKYAVQEKMVWEGVLKLMNLYLERSEDNDRSGEEQTNPDGE